MQRITSMPHWGIWWGGWWAVFFSFDRTFSFGVHIEPRRRDRGAKEGEPTSYGPYVDLHLPMFCISVGNHPVYVSSLDAQRSFARGGLT